MFDLPALTINFLEGDIVHAHFKDGHTAGRDDVESMFAVLREQGHGHKLLLLVSVGNGASLTNEARAYASGDEGNKLIAADAIIVRDYGHQMSANAFVRHHRPGRPAQLFPDQASAIAWLGQLHYLIDK